MCSFFFLIGALLALLAFTTGELLAVKRIHFDNITRDELAAIEQAYIYMRVCVWGVCMYVYIYTYRRIYDL